MSHDELPPDPDAVETWANLPQNEPSPDALPPVAGGTRWVWAFLILGLVIVVLGLLSQSGSG
jgi:hypothetical protein